MIDAGEDGGRPYIVFEYCDGETLKERIDRSGRLPLDEAAAYAIEVGRGLAAAHARRLVHRDVKPQNVLIDSEGRAKVTDFGIARALESGRPDEDRPGPRDDRLRLARAGDGQGGRRPLRHLLARRPPLRDADRRRPVQGREPRRRGDEARQRADAERAEGPPAGLLGARGRGRAGDPEGRPQALPGHGRDAGRPRGGARGRGGARRALDRRGDDGPRLGPRPPAPASSPRAPSPSPGSCSCSAARRGGADHRRGLLGRRQARRRWRWRLDHRGAHRRRGRAAPGSRLRPAGDEEHPDEVGLAIDGNPATTWSTETYNTGPIVADAARPGSA